MKQLLAQSVEELKNQIGQLTAQNTEISKQYLSYKENAEKQLNYQ